VPLTNTSASGCTSRRLNRNWSSGLTAWDRLRGALLLDVPQSEIVIGVPAYHERSAVTLAKVLAEPFREQPVDSLATAGWLGLTADCRRTCLSRALV
jgi:hypothetical protein